MILQAFWRHSVGLDSDGLESKQIRFAVRLSIAAIALGSH